MRSKNEKDKNTFFIQDINTNDKTFTYKFLNIFMYYLKIKNHLNHY